MRSSIFNLLVFPASIALGGLFTGCASLPQGEVMALGCGETKATTFNLSTARGPHPVGFEFTRTCGGDQNGVVVRMTNHPRGGIHMTMPRTIGPRSPDYEFIPCPDNVAFKAVLKAKWDDLGHYDDYIGKAPAVSDINKHDILVRFDQDARVRDFMLNKAKSICSGGNISAAAP